MNILVTGANGFVGKAFSRSVKDTEHFLTAVIRNKEGITETDAKIKIVPVGNILEYSQWNNLLQSTDCIVHLASTAHKIVHNDVQLELAFDNDIKAHKLLVKKAIEAGIKRYIYLSSVKVYGEDSQNLHEVVLTEESEIGQNCDLYGLSKIECENYLQLMSNDSAMEFVIIRSPLVYGEGVKANFKRLMSLANSPWFLPFSNFVNKRSMIAIDNLIDFIQLCCISQQAKNQVFLVSDSHPLSLSELLATMRLLMKRPRRLFYFPYVFILLMAKLVRKEKILAKLHFSLLVSTEKALTHLGWKPPISSSDALLKILTSSKTEK